jgi:hypothetical protein
MNLDKLTKEPRSIWHARRINISIKGGIFQHFFRIHECVRDFIARLSVLISERCIVNLGENYYANVCLCVSEEK